MMANNKRVNVLKMMVNVTSVEAVINKITSFIKSKKSSYICLSNVHMCMEVYDSRKMENVVNDADFVLPDGKPIYWMLKLLGYKKANHIRGMDLMSELCNISNDSRCRSFIS